FPSYRLFVIGVGFVVGVALWLLQERTKLGAMVRAAIDDAEIAQSSGINVSKLSTVVFAFGAGLAALGGIMAGPVLGVYPGADFEVLLLAFVVVIIGGLGSLKGAFVGVWLDAVAALAAATITAALFGLLALRTRGAYLLMITLALAQVLWGIAFGWRSFTGGDDGLAGIARPSAGLPWSLADGVRFYYFAL